MSDIDLTEAIDAVLTELGFGPAEDGALAIDWYRSGDSEKADAVAVGGDRNLVGVILDAALPKIEAAVRDRIKAELAAWIAEHGDPREATGAWESGVVYALTVAHQIITRDDSLPFAETAGGEQP